MQLIKRLPLLVPIALIAQLVFAVTSAAQGFNSLPAAGNYHITTSTADYFFCCGQDPSQPFLSVSVEDTTTVTSPSTTKQETDVTVNVCGGTNFVCGGGCFIAGATDFTTGGALSSAALNTTFDPATSQPCQNLPVSLPAFTLHVTWSGTSPVGTTRKTSTYSCAGYHAEVQTLTSNDHATASASSSLFTGSIPAETGSLGSIDQRIEAHGVAQDTCSTLGFGGGGKGAGPGPTGPGGFGFTTQSATVNSPPVHVNVTSFSSVSRPTGSAPSTFSETDLNVRSDDYFQPVDLCFVLQSPNTFAFGGGLSSASVHATIDTNTPACPHRDNAAFTPFTVDLTWTATGPLASIQSRAISDCGAFHETLLTTNSTNPATASGTISMFPDAFSGVQASTIDSGDRQLQSHGVAPQGCILRP